MPSNFDTSWFKLENYDGLKNLDLLGWHKQLSARSYLKIVLKSFPDDERLAQLCEAIKKDPIITDPFFDEEKEQTGYPFFFPFDTYSVKSTTFRDISGEILGGNAITDVARHALTCIDDRDIEEAEAHKGMSCLPIDFVWPRGDGECTRITVDLSVSNEMILRDFEHWLTGYRKYNGLNQIKKSNRDQKKPTTKITNDQINSWVENRVLPYLDLSLIALSEGIKIEDNIKKAQIARLIFPGNKLEDKASKSVRTLTESTITSAEFVLMPEVLDLLRVQAHHYKEVFKPKTRKK